MDSGEFLTSCVQKLVEMGGSDLHFKEGFSPRIRVKGVVMKTDLPVAEKQFLEDFLKMLLSDLQVVYFKKKGGVDFAFNWKNFGRFRGNFFVQRGQYSFVVRIIEMQIPTFEELFIPPIFEEVAMAQRGLILVSGATSAGKSTTVSAMVDYINHNREAHIITLEDPIEYMHSDDRAVINQREIGTDVDNFSEALKFVVRQDPDIIIIGEMRDPDSFQSAIQASETGHLVISTVHARDVLQCFDRILGFFPSDMHEQVLVQMSFNIKAITSQRLIPTADESGLIPAFEIMLSSPSVDKQIRENRLDKLQQLIQGGREDGMQTFNQALLALYQDGKITKEDALGFSDNPQALEMNIKGIFLDEGTGGILGDS